MIALLLVVAAVQVVSAGSAIAVAPPPPPRGNVDPALDPVPDDEVAVVAASAPVDGRIAVIVQNGTDASVRRVRVAATATRADGGRATLADTSGLLPAVLTPGSISLGMIRFRAAGDVPSDATLSFVVTSKRARSDEVPAALDVGSIVASGPLTGTVAQTLDVTLTNPNRRAVRRPLTVRVLCFGESRRPAVAVDTRIAGSKIASGGSRVATVKLRELCPTYLVAAAGKPARSRARQ